MSIIEIKSASVAYAGGASVLEDIDLSIERGEFVAVVGSNGAGKSTLLRLLNGLLVPKTGSVMVDGHDTHTTKTSQLARSVGFLFQNPDRQICCNTVAEELAFSLRGSELSPEQQDERVQAMLEEFSFDGSADPFSLGRGQRQRVALASALVSDPDILVLDEPTSGLDYRECMHIMQLIQQRNASGMTVVMVCHDMEVVADFASRIVVLAEGHLVDQGSPHELFRREMSLERAGLRAPQIIELATALGGDFSDADQVQDVMDVLCESRAQQGRRTA